MGAKADAKLAGLRRALKAVGLRVTAARTSVLNVLMDAKSPLSHSEVYERLADQSVDRVTVYRNLTDLVEAGVLHRTDLGDHVWRFELRSVSGDDADDTHGVHPHFLCSDCGAIACLPLSSVALRAVQGTPRSLRRRDVEIRVRGLCDACV
jgi:Fur family transcriptional regulator, ferric uptake regulator